MNAFFGRVPDQRSSDQGSGGICWRLSVRSSKCLFSPCTSRHVHQLPRNEQLKGSFGIGSHQNAGSSSAEWVWASCEPLNSPSARRLRFWIHLPCYMVFSSLLHVGHLCAIKPPSHSPLLTTVLISQITAQSSDTGASAESLV
jgi:hypothetical protein